MQQGYKTTNYLSCNGNHIEILPLKQINIKMCQASIKASHSGEKYISNKNKETRIDFSK